MSNEKISKKNSFLKRNFLIGAFSLFLLQFFTWPLVWHLILIPKSQPNLHGFRIEPALQSVTSESRDENFFPDTFFRLDKPYSSLFAFAIWSIPRPGVYQVKLTCDDNGKAVIDNHPVVTLEGINYSVQGEGKITLDRGHHFLMVQLNNLPGKGWMKIQVLKPDQKAFEPLDIKELSFIRLGNINTWLLAVRWTNNLCLLGFIIFSFLGFGLPYLRKRKVPLFPNKRWLAFFLILALWSLTISGIFFTKNNLPPIWGDGLGYYSYLPAYLIYHDLSMESLFSPTRFYDYPSAGGTDFHPGEGFYRYPGTGRYLVKYPIGMAIMMLPFFILGHLSSPLWGFIQDGFSPTYQVAVALSAIFFMLAGIYILFKIMIKHFSNKVVLITLFSLLFGTNLFNYGTVDVSNSHVYSFFLICLLLYQLPIWYDNPSKTNTLILGVVAGMIPLVRNPNACLLLIIPFYGITCWVDVKTRWQFFRQHKIKLLLFGFTLILLFIPQSLIWKYATDHFFLKAYLEEKLNFFAPKLFKVLFSFHHGLLIYSPVLVFGIIGLWTMKESLKAYRFLIIVGLLLQWYVVSSWYLWYYGWSFGHRAFVDILGFFALPMACFFGSLTNKNLKKFIFITVIFLMSLNSYLDIQYMEGILPGEIRPNITWKDYRRILVDPRGLQSLWQWLKDPQVWNRRMWENSHPRLFSNK